MEKLGKITATISLEIEATPEVKEFVEFAAKYIKQELNTEQTTNENKCKDCEKC